SDGSIALGARPPGVGMVGVVGGGESQQQRNGVGAQQVPGRPLHLQTVAQTQGGVPQHHLIITGLQDTQEDRQPWK
ncbi:hypothetical protein NHX12_016991, partial [Muraenolepis orangiensis]